MYRVDARGKTNIVALAVPAENTGVVFEYGGGYLSTEQTTRFTRQHIVYAMRMYVGNSRDRRGRRVLPGWGSEGREAS